MCLAGLGLAFFARRPHNAGDVGHSFLFQEGIVVVVGRNLCRVVAAIDDLLVLLDRGLRPGLFGLFQADDVGVSSAGASTSALPLSSPQPVERARRGATEVA